MSGRVKGKSLHVTLCANKLNLDSSLKCGLLFPLRKEITRGLSTLSAYFSREYHYVDLEKSWTDAQTYCRERFTDLATIDNNNDNQRLLTLANKRGKSDGSIWIGLYDDINSWRWSMEDKEFYVDRAAEFTTWFQGQPNNKDANQYCVAFNKKMQLNDLSCNSSCSFVCYDANSTTSYVLVRKKQIWSVAQAYCREHHGDLASIRNKEENDNIQLTLKESKVGSAWIGLYREPWAFWSDNSTSTFTNWDTDQPNKRLSNHFFGAFSANSGKWTSAKSELTIPFFCFKGINHGDLWQANPAEVIHGAAFMTFHSGTQLGPLA
eukprot:superscaffoldBa00001443_g10581